MVVGECGVPVPDVPGLPSPNDMFHDAIGEAPIALAAPSKLTRNGASPLVLTGVRSAMGVDPHGGPLFIGSGGSGGCEKSNADLRSPLADRSSRTLGRESGRPSVAG